jgi:Flp pilus assembly protein TadD
MAANRGKLILMLALACAGSLSAQTSKPTVRHHRVAEDFGSATLVQAEAAMGKNDYRTAETALHQAVQNDPQNYRAWYDLGLVYSATQRAPDAIAAYRKSIDAYPKLFEANFNLAVLLARSGNPEAEKYMRAATQLTPTEHPDQSLARAWHALGLWLQPKDPKQALEAFRRAADLQPEDASNHLSLAVTAERLGDTATAEQEYKAAVDRDPNSAEALAGLANLYLTSKRLPQAETALRQYLRVDPKNANARLQLGSMYIANKQFAKAEQLFRGALSKQPRDAELHHSLGAALLQQRKFAEAQSELIAAVRLKPDLGAAYGDLALAASENKDYQLTIKALELRSQYLPEVAATLFLRATAYDHLRAYQQAAQNYRRFLAAANGKFPDQEWQARHRLIAIEPKKR